MASLLERIKSGPQQRPHLVGLYGPGGVGKSTFAASAPKPIFIGTDDGCATLDVSSFPIPQTWTEANAQIDTLLHENHDYQTAVIDTINGLEPLLWAHLCAEARCKSIEEIDGGYGKGYVRANESWVEFWKKIKTLRNKMNVIALGHAKAKTVEDVMEGERFDRYMLKMHDVAALLFHESVDNMLFANFQVDFRKEKGAKKAKAFGTGKRVMFTEERPWFMAKSRFDLPFEMELSWDAFAKAATVQKTKSSDDELAAVFQGIEEEATAFLLYKEWIIAGQTWRDLPAAKRKTIVNRTADFKKAVSDFATKKEETPTEE